MQLSEVLGDSLVRVTPNGRPLTPSDCCQVAALPKVLPCVHADVPRFHGLDIASNELPKFSASCQDMHGRIDGPGVYQLDHSLHWYACIEHGLNDMSEWSIVQHCRIIVTQTHSLQHTSGNR